MSESFKCQSLLNPHYNIKTQIDDQLQCSESDEEALDET